MIKKSEFIKGLTAALGISAAAEVVAEGELFDFGAVLFRFPTDDTLQIIASNGVTLLAVTYLAEHCVAVGTRFIVSAKRTTEALDALNKWEGDRLSIMPYQDVLVFSSGADVHQAKRRMSGEYPDPENILTVIKPAGESHISSTRVIAALEVLHDLTGDDNPVMATRGEVTPMEIRSIPTSAAGDASMAEATCLVMSCT